jgi:hypothetical protein
MLRRKFTLLERTFIQKRAHYCCEYCKFPMAYSHDPFHIEHIIPLLLNCSMSLSISPWLVMAAMGVNGNLLLVLID